MLRRRSRLLPAAIGVLCVFTLVAGLTVARLLPHRLALWRPPSIAAARLAIQGPVLDPASGAASGAESVTPAGVSRALAPVVTSSAFGPSLGVLVTSLATGQVLYASNANSGFTPASTNKLATAAAVLKVLGPTARLTTRVVLGAGPAPSSWSAAGTRRLPRARRSRPSTRSRPPWPSSPAPPRRRCDLAAST